MTPPAVFLIGPETPRLIHRAFTVADARPLVLRPLGFQAFDFPLLPLLFAWLVILGIYDKFAGRLVPAICWGLMALPDDDRLPDGD